MCLSSIPVTLTTYDKELNTPIETIYHILKYIAPEITKNDYKIFKAFELREGTEKYPAKLLFLKSEPKKAVMVNKSEIKKLEENNPLYNPCIKIFIKHDTSPLARKETDRIYTKMKKLIQEDTEGERNYKIFKGKLLDGENIIDESNISNSIF